MLRTVAGGVPAARFRRARRAYHGLAERTPAHGDYYHRNLVDLPDGSAVVDWEFLGCAPRFTDHVRLWTVLPDADLRAHALHLLLSGRTPAERRHVATVMEWLSLRLVAENLAVRPELRNRADLAHARRVAAEAAAHRAAADGGVPVTGTLLHVTQCTDAGVPHVVAAQVAAASAAGWRTALACPGGGLADLGTAAGADVFPWHATRSPVTASLRREVRDLRSVVDAVGPDLVVLHSAKAGLVGRLALRGSVPTVFVPHAWSWQAATGAQRAGAVAWERRAARWTEVFACVGAGEAAEGRARGLRGRFAIVPNDIDAAAIRAAAPVSRAAARAALGLEARRPVAVCVARLAPQKDHDTLLRAWSAVVLANPAARLYLVGDGPLAAEVLADRPRRPRGRARRGRRPADGAGLDERRRRGRVLLAVRGPGPGAPGGGRPGPRRGHDGGRGQRRGVRRPGARRRTDRRPRGPGRRHAASADRHRGARRRRAAPGRGTADGRRSGTPCSPSSRSCSVGGRP